VVPIRSAANQKAEDFDERIAIRLDIEGCSLAYVRVERHATKDLNQARAAYRRVSG
jgi:hypothetical protein